MRRSLCLALVCCLCLAIPSFAQKTSGEIRGTVTDSSGAVVAGAEVSATNSGTGSTRTATTNDSGGYAVLDLQDGVYEVRIKKSSFKESITKNVELHVSSTAIVNAALEIGGASETMIVEASGVQVQTDSAVVGEIVDGRQVRELPLNGRSFAQLTQLQPGVAAAESFDSKNKGLLSGVDFSVNGNPTTNNLFLVDGANNNDVGSNRTILIYPSVEAISEFKMLRNSYGPEYGQASGAVISITTRSGQNQFHGTALYFGRNDALTAHEYFAARAESIAEAAGKQLPNNGKDKLRRNDYGYSIGGPIKKDKLFFFWSQEWNKELRGQTRQSCVPTAAELTGDFTTVSCGNAPHLPGGGATITNLNQIPGFLGISPAGLLIAKLLPTPNVTVPPGGNNWVQSVGSAIDWRQENFRADYNLTKKHSLMFRYTQDHWQNPAPNLQGFWGDDPFPSVEGSWIQPSKQIVGRITSTIGSSMVNDAAFTYSNNRITVNVGGTNPGLLAQITAAVPTIFPENIKLKHLGLPTIWGGLGSYGNGASLWGIAPWENAHDIYTARDDFSKISGKHTYKFGVFLGFDGKNENTGFGGSERPSFGGANGGSDTGNGLANILNQGTLYGMGETSTNVQAQLRWRDYEVYAGDTWKIRQNLTLEYGARWSLLAAPFAANNKLARFDPSHYDPLQPASDACNGLVYVPGTNPCIDSNTKFGTNFSAGTPGQNKSLVDTKHNAIAPRIGLSWDPRGDGKTAIRFGIGQFYQRERVSTQFVEVTNAPFALNIGGVNRTVDSNAAVVGAPTTSPSGGRDPRAILPNSWQWNATVEHQFARETALELGYVGNRSTHLSSSYDINQIAPANRLAGAFCGGSAYNCASLRPFSNFGGLTYWGHSGSSSYHSLQALFRTRYKRSQLQAAYTWSHSIADYDLTDSNGGGVNASSFTDNGNHRLDRGNSSINRPHIFVLNTIINLPTLDGRNAFLKGAAGGWEFGIISSAASGSSQTVFVNGASDANPGANNPAPLVSLSGTGLNGNQRPNAVAGVSCNSGTHGEQMFNPAAFTLVGYQLGTIGTAPRGACFGPKNVNTDFAFYKNWKTPFFQGEKLQIQFRVEMFNAFNHANFRADRGNNQNDLMSGGHVACGVAACSASNSVITSIVDSNGSFGKSNLTHGPREIQYGLKLIF